MEKCRWNKQNATLSGHDQRLVTIQGLALAANNTAIMACQKYAHDINDINILTYTASLLLQLESSPYKCTLNDRNCSMGDAAVYHLLHTASSFNTRW